MQKAYQWSKEEDRKIFREQPPSVPYQIQKLEEVQDEEGLSEEEKALIKQWLEDYKDWQERISEIDYISIERQREASNSLAFIAVGLPLYFYHWKTIKKETKDKE